MTSFRLGYSLSSEEFPPNEMVRNAVRAEEVGFSTAWISDHFHPWIDRQGHSPFVWSVIGGIAAATENLRVGTGVTCPTIRIHPAIIAQAAATSACMFDGRFFLGVGTGENLNEHILGDRWPSVDERLEMLEEAIEVMRLLWRGGSQSHRGRHYTVDNARIYTLPDSPPPIYMSAFGTKAAAVAGRIADGFASTRPDKESIAEFRKNGGKGKPLVAGLKVCWADDVDTATKYAHELWPTSAVSGELSQELPSPQHFEQASEWVTPEHIAEQFPLGPDPEVHLEAIRAYVDAGYDEIYVHQIGPDQEGFFKFYAEEIFPALQS
jgi:G6PDH family F420-dependent oxidoreductase